MKKLITVSQDSYFDGPRSLSETMKWLQDCIDELPAEYRESVTFTLELDSPPYSDNEYPKLMMQYNRIETDEEEQARQSREKATQDRLEQRDRLEYERLQKKFAT
jgi:hypothetical protein